MGVARRTEGARTIGALRLNSLGIAAAPTLDADADADAAAAAAAAAKPGPADTVRALLAMQAQDYPGTLWAVGLRTPGSTLASVEAAHESGAFVRSWPMRGTLHVTAPDDLGWMLGLTAERQVRSASGRHRQLELTDDDFARANDVARGMLSGGSHADRAELLAGFTASGISIAGQRGIHLIGYLATTGVIVLRGQKSYALLDEWTTPRVLTRDEALAELALRYFTGHGPATVRDLAWWSSLTLTEARAGLAAVRESLIELVVNDVSYFHRPGLEPAADAVHLLPGFDEYVLGYTDRTAVLAREHFDAVVPGGNGMFLSTIVVNGEIVGTWRRDRSAKRIAVTLQPFGALSATTVRRIRTALAAYGDFVETPVELVG